MTDDLLELIYQLHQGPANNMITSYQDWALEKVHKFLPFDAAEWITGHLNPDGSATITQSNPFITQSDGDVFYFSSKSPLAKPLEKLPLRDGTFCSLPPIGEYLQLADANDADPLIPQHGLWSLLTNKQANLFWLVALYRTGSASFNEKEHQFKQKLILHLVQACDRFWLNQLILRSQKDQQTPYRTAQADLTGYLLVSEPKFESMLLQEFPGWTGPRLPEPLHPYGNGNATGDYLGKLVSIKSTLVDNTHLLRIRPKTAFECLSRKERLVARDYSEALTFKEIALAHHISPATVRNHIANIYLKLGITDKTQLVALVIKED